MIHVLALFAFPIALADIKDYKIPNIYLKVLSIFAMGFLLIDGLGKISFLLSISVSLTLLLAFGIGMGDVKLLAIIAISLNSSNESIGLGYPIVITLFACVHLLIISICSRSIPSKIPLAPSIFLALPFI